MGINHDEFSEGVEPIKPINAKATTAEGGGNGAAGNGTAGAPLEPNRADINAHLYALFHPNFVLPHPDAWIEIATANPKAGKGKTGPMGAEHFSAFDLQAAADFAERQNRKGFNIYVGVALRQGKPARRAARPRERHHGGARVGGFRQVRRRRQGADLRAYEGAAAGRGHRDRRHPAPPASGLFQPCRRRDAG